MLPQQKIMTSITKGYRRPHDIAVLASEIYTLLRNGDMIDSKTLTEFTSSVNNSKFPDIIELAFNYLKSLSKSEGKLLPEESKKIGHLFDSINIMATLGLRHDNNTIEESDRLILDALKSKKLANLSSQIRKGRPW